MSAQCAICFSKFGFFRGSITCKSCLKAVCKKCTKDFICIQCRNPELRVQGYDEVPKNLYEQSVQDNFNRIASQINQLPPPVEKVDPQDEALEKRLAALRNGTIDKQIFRPVVRLMSVSDPDQDEEAAVKNIIQKTLSELEIEKNSPNPSEPMDTDSANMTVEDKEIEDRLKELRLHGSSGQLPRHKWSWQIEEEKIKQQEEEEMAKWCCICNANGHFKCRDCDNDVYCKRCFKVVLKFQKNILFF